MARPKPIMTFLSLPGGAGSILALRAQLAVMSVRSRRRRCSGGVLSLEDVGHGAVPVSRSGQRHDERRLCLLHVLSGPHESHRPPVAHVR